MLEVLETARKASRWGRDSKLKIEDVLLMALEYLREYIVPTFIMLGL